MNVRFAVRCVVATALLTAGIAQAWAAPTAADVIQKSKTTYNAMKTYQGKWQMDMKMGQMGSMSMLMDVKMLPGKAARIATSPVGQATGMMAMGAAMSQMQMVDDGKTAWTYMPAMKMYTKAPSQVKTQSIMDSMVGGRKLEADYKLLPAKTIAGRPCFAIKVIPKAANGANANVVIYIDQATYRLKRMVTTASRTMGTGPNAQKMDSNMTMVINSETVNGAISPNLFKFSPPAGTKEMDPRMMGGGMGGGPGAAGMSGGAPTKR